MAQLCQTDADERYALLNDLLQQCSESAYDLSEEVGAIYFTHSDQAKHSVGV